MFRRIAEGFYGISALGCHRWTPQKLRDFQSLRLRYLMQHCYREVPLYRRRFDETGLDLSAIGGIEDLAKLPILRRTDLQAAAADAIAASRAGLRMKVNRTSGSSGAPLSLRKTVFEYWLLMATRLLHQLQLGFRPWERRFSIARIREGSGPPRFWWNRFGLLRQWKADCLEPIPQILAKLRAARPAQVDGYAGMVALVAATMTAEDRAVIRPRVVRCGAETVTPAMRAIIEEGFGTQVHVSYGAHEFNVIAGECAKTGLLHVAGGNLVAEVVRDGQPVAEGEAGELLLTALHTHAMPLVRYAIGDIVTKGPDPCPCGAPFATLRDVQGRVMEFFVLPDGTKLHPYALVFPLVHGTPCVRQYQLIQERHDLIRAKVVGLPPTEPQLRARVVEILEAACGNQVRVEVEPVEEIRPEANGKFRPYYTLVAQDSGCQNPSDASMVG